MDDKIKLEPVSILIPTYGRRKFNELIMNNLIRLNYPKPLLEVIIYDDHPTEPHFNNDAEVKYFQQCVGIKTRYIYRPEKHLTIGDKRNKMVKLASHKYCYNMDSDDIYYANCILYSLVQLKKNKVGLVGSAQMLFVYPHYDWKVTGIRCQHKRMIHEATMLFTKKHWRSMGGFNTKGYGEGCKMIDNFEKNCADLDITHIMVCVCHNDNSVPKDRFNEGDSTNLGEIDKESKHILSRIFEISKT